MRSVFVRFPDGRRKALTFSYDDGHPCDERLINIFDKYGLRGTFNINYNSFMGRFGKTEEDLKKRVELYKNHEVAVHGLTHPHLDTLSQTALTYEIFKDREGLEKLFGEPYLPPQRPKTYGVGRNLPFRRGSASALTVLRMGSFQRI